MLGRLPNLRLNINKVWGRKIGLGIYRSPSGVIILFGPHPKDIRQMFLIAYEKDRRKGLVKNLIREQLAAQDRSR